MPHLRDVLRPAAVSIAGLCLLACSSGPTTSADPVTDLRNPSLTTNTRTKAVAQAVAAADAGTEDPKVVREALKDLAWSPATPNDLRVAALDAVLRDPDHEDDSQEMVRLMLPREPKEDAAELMSEVAAERGWTDATPALVRSLSRHNIKTADQKRPEWIALEKLHPGRPMPEIAYSVFLDPQTEPGPRAIRYDERTRADAWDLLARLDPTGETRASLILGTNLAGAPESAHEVVGALRSALEQLHCVPITGDELRWLLAIRQSTDARAQAWWSESASAISRLPSDAGRIELRHIEPIRWAAANRPEWLGESRESLLSQAQQVIESRELHERSRRMMVSGLPAGETLRDWNDFLRWGDAISLLVINDAVSTPSVNTEIARQAALDRADKTTEYGGIVEWRDGGWVALLYPPRPNQRVNDHTFIASDDMINASNLALIHYHLHVQDERNTSYAGPSEADLTYAARSGRTCAVFTSVGPGRADVDVYMPNGGVIDLGEIAFSPEG